MNIQNHVKQAILSSLFNIKAALLTFIVILIGSPATYSTCVLSTAKMSFYNAVANRSFAVADTSQTLYLSAIVDELQKKWPANKNINLVFHGHSVPSGYFQTPNVNTFGSYPFLLLKQLNEKYPYAVINVIKTCIGGENAEKGALRFKKDVLSHKPDVVFIDYALNDRVIGLSRAKSAWEKMIRQALRSKIKIVLLTPTPDISENILDDNALLAQHTRQIIALGAQYGVPVVDSYNAFKKLKENGDDISKYMAQSNHVNEQGHQIVASLLFKLFQLPLF